MCGVILHFHIVFVLHRLVWRLINATVCRPAGLCCMWKSTDKAFSRLKGASEADPGVCSSAPRCTTCRVSELHVGVSFKCRFLLPMVFCQHLKWHFSFYSYLHSLFTQNLTKTLLFAQLLPASQSIKGCADSCLVPLSILDTFLQY